jgi:hypothetical protein
LAPDVAAFHLLYKKKSPFYWDKKKPPRNGAAANIG